MVVKRASSPRSPARLDQKHVWHPFTQMRDWLREEPVVITSGKGAWIRDQHGRRYLDANASIWTNLHGHRHPVIDRSISRQLRKIAHSSALGLANVPASQLAEKLVRLAPDGLEKVFYSDDGSTALEAALKMVFQHGNQSGNPKKSYLTLENGYHGDTVGAMSLGGVDAFHRAYKALMFKTEKVPSPYCYRCPWNRAKPEREDAREYRKCHWECIGAVERKISGAKHAAAVMEPLVQGAAGMIMHPRGYLGKFAALCRREKVPLILDEVMTGFGRTGRMFATEHEGVEPDFLCLSKGITGGYLPLGATLTTNRIFRGFLGEYSEKKTFFHGHSYTGNPLGCAAALGNLEVFEKEKTLQRIRRKAVVLGDLLQDFWKLESVGDVRQTGLVAGIELVQNWKTRKPYRWEDRVGVRVCMAARKHGVMTRPIGNVLVIMPPYCVTGNQLEMICQGLQKAIREVC